MQEIQDVFVRCEVNNVDVPARGGRNKTVVSYPVLGLVSVGTIHLLKCACDFSCEYVTWSNMGGILFDRTVGKPIVVHDYITPEKRKSWLTVYSRYENHGSALWNMLSKRGSIRPEMIHYWKVKNVIGELRQIQAWWRGTMTRKQYVKLLAALAVLERVVGLDLAVFITRLARRGVF